MVTAAPGYIVDPSNSNAVIKDPNAQIGIGGTPIAPTPAAASVTPAPYSSSPAAPATSAPYSNPNSGFQNNVQGSSATQNATPQGQTININTAPSAPQTQNSAPQSTQTQNTSQAPPQTNLQPGAQGQDVQALQNYLVQMGYLTSQQLATGPGIYGPQTTAAVAKMQQDLGIQAGSAQGSYGAQTQEALAQKYQGLFSAVKGTAIPTQGGDARNAIQGALDLQSSNTNDPIFGALSASMAPIMQSLTQVLSNINNPALSATSLQQEYNTLRTQYNLPGMNAQLMNMQNIMNGTTDDIRSEITTAGGNATESQVQAMSAARNTTILKQYNALSTQYSAAQTNVQAMMQYAQTDQSNVMQRQQLTASVTASLASIQNQMLQMGMTMQNNARSAVQYNVTQMGYRGLAQSAQDNPQMLGYYENMLGLAPGTLSDPNSVANMDTYKNQQLLINQYRASAQGYNVGFSPASFSPSSSTGQYGTATSTISQITGYAPNASLAQVNPGTLASAIIKNEGSSPQGVLNNPGNIKFAGLPGQTNSGIKATDGGTFANYSSPQAGQQAITANIQAAIKNNPNQTLGAFIDRYTNTAPTNNSPQQSMGQIGTTPVDPTTLVRPAFVDNGVPLTLTADQMTQYMSTQKAATIDPGTNNIVAPGIGYYQQQSDGSYVLKSALPSSTDSQYNQIKQTIASAPPFSASPKVTSQWTTAANKELSSFKQLGTYQVLSTVAPYMANIRAAQTNPGSISDLELIDSYVRLSKGGTGQVTGDQVDIALKGAGFSDSAQVLQQKMQNGGVFSTNQRQQIVQLASQVYNENASDYKKIYVAATQGLKGQGIPVQFWSNLPDLNSLLSGNAI